MISCISRAEGLGNSQYLTGWKSGGWVPTVAQYGYFDRFCVVGVVTLARTYESLNFGLRPLGPALTIAVRGSL